MRIEEEIYQKSFKSEEHKLMVNLLYTASWLNIRQTRFFKPYGISYQQYNVLRILRGHAPKAGSIALIQERMIDKSSNTSRLVDKLESKGLVVRTQSKHDRRQVDVSISKKGMALLDEIEVFLDSENVIFDSLNKKDKVLLNELLDKLRTIDDH